MYIISTNIVEIYTKMLNGYDMFDSGTPNGLVPGSHPGFYLPLITTISVVIRIGLD